jgi:hypothetical protein
MTQLKKLTESFFSIKDVGFFSGKEASPILFCFFVYLSEEARRGFNERVSYL